MILRSLRRLAELCASTADVLEELVAWLEDGRTAGTTARTWSGPLRTCHVCRCAVAGNVTCQFCGAEPLSFDTTSRLHGPGDHGWRCGKCEGAVDGRKGACGRCS